MRESLPTLSATGRFTGSCRLIFTIVDRYLTTCTSLSAIKANVIRPPVGDDELALSRDTPVDPGGGSPKLLKPAGDQVRERILPSANRKRCLIAGPVED